MKKTGLILLLTLYVIVTFAQSKDRFVFEDVEFEVHPADQINTIGSDIAPTFVEGDLYFSGISDLNFKRFTPEKESTAFYNVYNTKLDENGDIISARNPVSGLGHDKIHEGPIAYCEATEELFVTLSNELKLMQSLFYLKDINLKLAIAKKVNNRWEIVSELPFNDDQFNFAHPAITQTGDTLIFSSNKDTDSFGGADLFMSIRKNGEWSSPVNLGDSINTEGNEMYPTFLENNLISFASDGRNNGFGKLDIWYTTFPEEGEIINMGNRVNSHLDDFGLVIHPNKEIGYFSSEISVRGSDDIYRLEIKKLYRIFNGKVLDDRTGAPVPYSKVDLIDCNSDIIRSVITDNLGNFSFEVIETQCPQIEVSKEGYDYNRKSILQLDYLEIRLKNEF